jgi:uncharacterized protein YegP (UPF0339 family)
MKLLRRMLVPLIVAITFAASGVQFAPAQAKKEKPSTAKVTATFEVYKDKSGAYRFRLKDDEGTLLAMSPKGFKTKADCEKTIDGIKREVGRAEIEDPDKDPIEGRASAKFEMYKDKGGQYRFRFKDKEGTSLAIATKGYKTKEHCRDVIATIKRAGGKIGKGEK